MRSLFVPVTCIGRIRIQPNSYRYPEQVRIRPIYAINLYRHHVHVGSGFSRIRTGIQYKSGSGRFMQLIYTGIMYR